MSNRKDHETMNKLDRCYKLVQQSSARGGIRAVEIAEKMGVHRTRIYDQLRSLEFAGKIYSDQGYWKATTGEQTIKPSEKEIVIKLPLQENKLKGMVGLKLLADSYKDAELTTSAKMMETIIDTFNETRTIIITGKNVDDLNLEKIGNLVQQANEKSSKVNLKGLLKKFKR